MTLFLDRHADKWMPEPNTGCWIWFGAWTAATKSSRWVGYGCVRRNGKTALAHRTVYSEANEIRLSDKDVVRHSCDNPCCINPEHLVIGSMKDNSQDAIRRGRWNPGRGERHGSNVVSEAQVREIRTAHSGKHGHTKALAERYGVSRRTIHQIVAKETWGWLP